MSENRGSFPWRIWLKLNGVCLPGFIWFLVNFSQGETLILAAFTILPINVLVLTQWARGRIHGDVLGKWGGSRAYRTAVASAFLILFVGTFCAYYYSLGESLGRVLLVGGGTLLIFSTALMVGVWLRGQGKSDRAKRRPDLPEVM